MKANKTLIRQEIISRRKTLSSIWIEEVSRLIIEKLESLKAYQEAESLFAYLSLPGEVATGRLLERALFAGKRVGVPVIDQGNIHAVSYQGEENLIEGAFAVKEPRERRVFQFDERTLILVPGLAFDPKGNRLGFGKGFYDRFLADKDKNLKIGLAFEFQLREKLPVEAGDVPVDWILSEEKWITIKNKD
ncbi:MAG: 5-formyltetrahydrofolate cyclo-ligase [Spirochaetae bacterium HGW-Spirochaetae-6]|nr:MAG: 5-formyltetrahydrofolate cyclo-ligase [Spirochaetae bacterium HGW-Spirochaetae-6]